MATALNLGLLDDIRAHGAFDISACFHCGNCTAVCPLSEEGSSFPRKLIRLGQIGAREQLLSSPDPWLCYYCGECSDTCPREAGPGEYMAALRRYTIAENEPTGLARIMYGSLAGLLGVTVVLALALGMFMVSGHGSAPAREWLFSLVPYGTLHLMGMLIFAAAGLSMAWSIGTAARRVLRGVSWPGWPAAGRALRRTVVEVATMARHRGESVTPETPLAKSAAGIHLGIMYGFLGLLVATMLDYLFLDLLPLGLTTFWPARFIGTVAGLAMLWGVVAAIRRRLARAERNVAQSDATDWWVLASLLVLAVTGFWLELAVTIRAVGPTTDAVMLLHAALAMELVLLTMFTKMAHVVYRPLALLARALRNPE